jgi:branched-chain amino acid transport system substrate-binding protein
MKLRFWTRLFPAVLLLVLSLNGCSKKNDDTIKVGLAGVQTGQDGQLGMSAINGSQAAIDEWNEKGGLLGKKIVPVVRDDEGKPDKAVTVAQELVSSGVFAIVGHFNSGCTIPASTVYHDHNLVNITPGSTNPAVTDRGFKMMFRICGRDDQQGKVAAEFIRQKLNFTKLAILNDKTAYGEGIAQEVKKTFLSLGGKVVNFTGIGKNELDFRANLTLIANSGAEALYWGGTYSQAGPMVVQMRQMGIKIPFVSGDGTFEQNFIDTAGASASDVYLTFGPDYKTLASAQPFLEKYRKKYRQEGTYTIYGYDAVNVLFTAVEAAGTTDPATVAAVLHSKTFDTSLGQVEFDEKGDLKKANYVIWTVKNASFVVLP